jgi:endonuclease/exonuclease/phosphatase family metal-dependent hydrolase
VNLITWNLQWCRGLDGRVDPGRIVAHARTLADFDVLCVQEIASGFPDLPGSEGEDQFELLERLLPGFVAVTGLATDLGGEDGRRRRFGNLLLSRLPVIAAYRHLLPWPADATVPSMQRVAVETVVQTLWAPVRISTTHLEYYSAAQRAAQVERLRALHVEACAHANDPAHDQNERGPFARTSRPASSILCGDFNFRPDGAEYRRLQSPFDGSVPSYRDAWSIVHPGTSHVPTFRVHEAGIEPYCCDFVFVTKDLVERVAEVNVDIGTQVSDHQPVVLQMRDHA